MKFVYFFGNGNTEGNSSMIDILGGKGAGLAEMSKISIPVPPGFTISSDLCIEYIKNKRFSEEFINQVKDSIKRLEEITNKKIGDISDPLLVSVRSGSRVSMPGMMDTILNLGLNDESVIGLSKSTNNEWFAYDCYRRFISMFGNVVFRIKENIFNDVIETLKQKKKYSSDLSISIEDLKYIINEYKKIIYNFKNVEFPQNPYDQLLIAIGSVFESWNNKRARIYRTLNNIPYHWGTSVNIQSMVYGNKGC